MSDISTVQDIDQLDNDYVLICKDINDIINDANFKDKREEDSCRMIIDFIEKNIANGIKNYKCMQLPFVGCMRYNPMDKAMLKYRLELKFARKNMSKEEYKEYFKSIWYKEKSKVQSEEIRNRYISSLRSINKKRYNELYLKFGRAYAEAYVYTLTLLEYVPFNQEIQDRYDELEN